jgi:ATP-dependent RNA helicase SUPV3L1/SUV3
MTGQERKDVPFANVTSCTIEMLDVNQQYDVAVIDEIQLIGNQWRGYAWTRAFLGLQVCL